MAQSLPTTRSATKAPYQYLALAVGAGFLLAGVAGFAVTGFDGFVEDDHDVTLLGFAVNPLHNIVHLVIGAAGIALWSSPARARAYGWLLAAGYGVATVYGFFAVNDADIDILNINGADNGLHALSTMAGLAIALWPDRSAH